MSEPLSILIIEDDEEDLFLFKKTIQGTDAFSITHATNLVDGIIRIKEKDHDLILLDLNLPDSQGIGTLNNIKQEALDTPIVVLTGLKDSELVMEAVQSGAQDFLEKKDLTLRILTKTILYAIERQKLVKNIYEREKTILKLVNELEEKNNQLEQLSIRDPLTGLYNRRFFDEHLKLEFGKSKRYSDPLSLFMIDIDHFKEINDNHGHNTGDNVLKAIANILLGSTRESDVCGRFGGDEYIIYGKLDMSSSSLLSKRILEEIRSIKIKELNQAPTVSIGVCVFESTLGSKNDFFNLTDKALYKAKEEGRDRAYIFHTNEYHLVT